MGDERPDTGFWCMQCHEHYQNESDAEDCCQLQFTIPAECDCYRCTESVYEEDQFGEVLMNNLEYHTFRERCEDCGEPKTEHLDLGHKGRYVCSECHP